MDLPGTKIKSPVDELECKAVLQQFDVPLLIELRAGDQADGFLGYWCDVTDGVDRWMVTRVNRRQLVAFRMGSLSLRNLLLKGGGENFVFFLDRGDGSDAWSYCPNTDIPDDYLPEEIARYDASLDPQHSSGRLSLLTGDIEFETGNKILRRMCDLYSVFYVTFASHQANLSPRPFRGGFSTVSFWSEIRGCVPAQGEPRVLAAAFASPGYFELAVDRQVAVGMIDVVHRFDHDGAVVAHSALVDYLKQEELWGREIDAGAVELTSAQQQKLGERTARLSERLEMTQTAGWLKAASYNQLIFAQSIRSVYRCMDYIRRRIDAKDADFGRSQP